MNQKIQITLDLDDYSIIENVLKESKQLTALNITKQGNKQINTGIPTKILKKILENKERALNSFKTNKIYINN